MLLLYIYICIKSIIPESLEGYVKLAGFIIISYSII